MILSCWGLKFGVCGSEAWGLVVVGGGAVFHQRGTPVDPPEEAVTRLPLASRKGTLERFLKTFPRRMAQAKADAEIDWISCAKFARQRNRDMHEIMMFDLYTT